MNMTEYFIKGKSIDLSNFKYNIRIYAQIFRKRGVAKMTSEELREAFIQVLKEEFPAVMYRPTTLKSGNIRISPYVPNHKRDKRWMQLDANPEYLSIAMDHFPGDITMDDLKDLGLPYGLNGSKSAFQKNEDAVKISIFIEDSYDFTRKEFIEFLHKHYESYLRLISD